MSSGVTGVVSVAGVTDGVTSVMTSRWVMFVFSCVEQKSPLC